MIVSEATYLMQIFASGFLAILLLQSGIDKVRDRGGNFEWLKGHFAKSPLAGIVTALLICITIPEVAAGALSAVGCLLIIVSKDSTIAFYGAILSAAAITALFLGGESRRIMLAGQSLFPTFCSRWSQFICLHTGKRVRIGLIFQEASHQEQETAVPDRTEIARCDKNRPRAPYCHS